MEPAAVPTIEELRQEFLRAGVFGIQALLLAQQKFIDMSRGVNLPIQAYLDEQGAKDAC